MTKLLIPTPITGSMLASSTVAEPAAGETAWASGGTYAVGDYRVSTTAHRIYSCTRDHAGRTTAPENDAGYWNDEGPSNRWAMFDNEVSTQTLDASGTYTVVLRPGNVSALAIYKIAGTSATITIKDAPGGTVVYTQTFDLSEPPLDWYDWAFGRIKPLDRLVVDGLVPYYDCEATITITNGSSPAGAGMFIVGDMVSLLGESTFGGTQYGATVEPVTFSYISTDEFGTTSIKRRKATTDMRISVALEQTEADYAISVVQSVLDVPCAVIATTSAIHQSYNVFGLVSGSYSADSYRMGTFNLYVKGMI